jgi:hypothetical protein
MKNIGCLIGLICCAACSGSSATKENESDSSLPLEDSDIQQYDGSNSIVDTGSADSSVIDTGSPDSYVMVDSGIKDSSISDTSVFDSAGPDTSVADSGVVDSSLPDSETDATMPFDGGDNGIEYHGGQVMTGIPNVYFLWYGDWNNNTATTILPRLMNNLSSAAYVSGNEYMNIATTYYDVVGGIKSSLSGKFNFAGSWSIPATITALNDVYPNNDTEAVAFAFATNQGFTIDEMTDDIFFVLTAPNITESASFGSFCVDYCGWHKGADFTASPNNSFKWAFVGDPDTQCPLGCEPNMLLNEAVSISPNNNPGADAMASVIMHELFETLTDPVPLTGWYHNNAAGEIGDLCAWKFGTTYTLLNGGIANINIGGNDYLLQQMWSNSNGGYCTMSLP